MAPGRNMPATLAEGRWRSGKPEWGRKADPCRPRIRRTPPVNPASGLEVGGSGGHGLYRNSFFEKLHVSLRLFLCSSVFSNSASPFWPAHSAEARRMHAVAAVVPVVHTRSWKDQDLDRARKQKSLRKPHSDKPLAGGHGCTCVRRFGWAATCTLHNTAVVESLDKSSPKRPRNAPEASPPLEPSGQPQPTLDPSDLISKGEMNGDVVSHAETQTLNQLGAVESERQHLCEYFYGDAGAGGGLECRMRRNTRGGCGSPSTSGLSTCTPTPVVNATRQLEVMRDCKVVDTAGWWCSSGSLH
ncbi:hypothetical protein ACCO45_007673 [Purpureocillium lilacinum]|uniref:Uncharacterized protein n=1 Tax=Purpureocillium lilacinum TaxID=33203 RepID=A0ACC4DP44_PURLI